MFLWAARFCEYCNRYIITQRITECKGHTTVSWQSSLQMEKCSSPLHVINAQISELELIFLQSNTKDKKPLDSNGACVAKGIEYYWSDSRCRRIELPKETAEIIVNPKADCFLCKKDHVNLKTDIEDYI